MSSISGGIDGVEVRFDEGSLVGDEVFLTLRDRLPVFSSRIGGCAVVVVWSC